MVLRQESATGGTLAERCRAEMAKAERIGTPTP